MRPKGSAAELEQRRRRAIALLEQGVSPTTVAKALKTSRASVTRWRQAHEQGGETAVAAKPHPSMRPKLMPAKMKLPMPSLKASPELPTSAKAVAGRMAT